MTKTLDSNSQRPSSPGGLSILSFKNKNWPQWAHGLNTHHFLESKNSDFFPVAQVIRKQT
jgi:hypothetical protein